MFTDVAAFGIDAAASAQATTYAERYVHYFNGVNPIQLVYLSNMGAFGAESSVTRFFHTWSVTAPMGRAGLSTAPPAT